MSGSVFWTDVGDLWTCLFFPFLALIRQDHGVLTPPDIFYTNLHICILKSKSKKEKGTRFAHALNKAL